MTLDDEITVESTMIRPNPPNRICINPTVCGGQPCIRDTRIDISIVLDGLAEGLTPEQVIDHYPQLTVDDIHAALAYAAELSRENVWKVVAG